MSAAPHPLALAEAWLRDHHHRLATKLEEAMSHLSDLIDNGKQLAAERVALIADRDAEKARADAAEQRAADLQAKIDTDDATASGAADDLAAEIARESGVSVGPAPAPSGPTGDTAAAAEPLDQPAPQVQLPAPAAPVTTTAPSGATVTVDPDAGTTTHVDSVAGITTTLDHASGAATATDASGAAVQPAPAVVVEAAQATTAAGVTVASAVDPAPQAPVQG